MNFFHHKDLGNHLLQLCPKVLKHPVYIYTNNFFLFLFHQSIQKFKKQRSKMLCEHCKHFNRQFLKRNLTPNYTKIRIPYTCPATIITKQKIQNLRFFIIKLTRCTNFPDLLRHENLHVSGSSSTHHQKFIHCTLYTAECRVYSE